jgi:hypothetical protein
MHRNTLYFNEFFDGERAFLFDAAAGRDPDQNG